MSNLRFEAIKQMWSRQPLEVVAPSVKVSDFFNVNVFTKEKMQKFLTEEAYEHILECIESGQTIDRAIAEQIAAGMKAWALEHGVTHYTHWFNPLTDGTAEKHDAFFEKNIAGQVFESFTGDKLVQQEPDASSFPNGGIRQTFEARGYTAWDPSSPAFIMNNTLCIPTIFISYTGDSLDYKKPLLGALHAVNRAATDVCAYFDKNVERVTAYLGWEQEYFLIDEALYDCRPDLILTERTLMGHVSAKNQQLEDHYFASIPERVACYMKDLEFESYKLGIPLKTRHNEVAPNQFECAPIFEEVNLAIDHNQVLMDIMKRIARRHNFRVLFHEKPFKGVNGTGKHNNWSLITDTGVNLYKPGKTPKSNLQFLVFIVNTITAVFNNQDLLRAAIQSHSNEHRLGANEAPPAIISAFLGTEITKMLDEIESEVSDRIMSSEERTRIKLEIGRIPEILLDNTDRNRTSPFAFTGNRFEFRAVGGSANCSNAMIVLNAVVADQLIKYKADVDTLINSGMKKDEALIKVMRKLITYSKNIRFDGDGYSQEWRDEAARRGLTNITSTPEALKAWIAEPSIEMFTRLGIMTERELHSRFEIRNEIYIKKLQIEARVLEDMAINHIIPTAVKYQSLLVNNVKGLKDIMPANEFPTIVADEIATIKDIAQNCSSIRQKVQALRDIRTTASAISDANESAAAYYADVKPCFESIRQHIDALEQVIDDQLWPLPKYREMLWCR